MRILMSVHHQLDAKYSPSGVTLLLADALRSRGHSVDIISHDCLGTPSKIKAVAYPFFVALFAAAHRSYDVLDLSSADGWVLSLFPRALFGVPPPLVVTRSHCLEHIAHEAHLELNRLGLKRLSWKYPLYHGSVRLWQSRRSFAHADLALFLNDFERQYAIERLGVRPQCAVMVKNGIADTFLERARTMLAEPDDRTEPCKIAFIGRYTQLKGSRYLASALRNILPAYPKSALGLFGVMAQPSEVLRDYPPEVQDRISVVPTYSNEQLVELLSGYHILAFPSIVEGFPIAPLEAMACGLVPVVAAASGTMSYIQDGRNGIIVPAKDAQSLEKGIAGLLNDPGRWRALRRAATSIALQHSYDTIACDLEQLYLERRPVACVQLG